MSNINEIKNNYKASFIQKTSKKIFNGMAGYQSIASNSQNIKKKKRFKRKEEKIN